MDTEPPSFDVWAADPRNSARERLVWRLRIYRVATYALHVGWHDAVVLSRHPITRPIAAQLYRALGSIGANVAEGYSRSSGRDRARLYEYALGSARECVVWYRAAIPVLGESTSSRRSDVLHDVICMLLTVIPRERARTITRAHEP